MDIRNYLNNLVCEWVCDDREELDIAPGDLTPVGALHQPQRQLLQRSWRVRWRGGHRRVTGVNILTGS